MLEFALILFQYAQTLKVTKPRTDLFGMHFPHGVNVVNFTYGPAGMFKNPRKLSYTLNYYKQYGTDLHPFDKEMLIQYSRKDNHTTCRDANGYLLFSENDFPNTTIINADYSFHEHCGLNRNLELFIPFNNYWYDDNYLARFMADAYDKPSPHGITPRSGFIRWKILGGQLKGWQLYNSTFHVDQIALDGIYQFHTGQFDSALDHAYGLLSKSNYTWNTTSESFMYAAIAETYHIGLIKVLIDLIVDKGNSFSSRIVLELLQHSISIKHLLLERISKNSTLMAGWVTNLNPLDTSSLINTETNVISSIALGANAYWTFEPNISPMQPLRGSANNHILSISRVRDSFGYVLSGPYVNIPTGSYSVQFTMRFKSLGDKCISIQVIDSSQNDTLAIKNISSIFAKTGTNWTVDGVQFEVSNMRNVMEFRVYWTGACDLDLNIIRVKPAYFDNISTQTYSSSSSPTINELQGTSSSYSPTINELQGTSSSYSQSTNSVNAVSTTPSTLFNTSTSVLDRTTMTPESSIVANTFSSPTQSLTTTTIVGSITDATEALNDFTIRSDSTATFNTGTLTTSTDTILDSTATAHIPVSTRAFSSAYVGLSNWLHLLLVLLVSI